MRVTRASLSAAAPECRCSPSCAPPETRRGYGHPPSNHRTANGLPRRRHSPPQKPRQRVGRWNLQSVRDGLDFAVDEARRRGSRRPTQRLLGQIARDSLGVLSWSVDDCAARNGGLTGGQLQTETERRANAPVASTPVYSTPRRPT